MQLEYLEISQTSSPELLHLAHEERLLIARQSDLWAPTNLKRVDPWRQGKTPSSSIRSHAQKHSSAQNAFEQYGKIGRRQELINHLQSQGTRTTAKENFVRKQIRIKSNEGPLIEFPCYKSFQPNTYPDIHDYISQHTNEEDRHTVQFLENVAQVESSLKIKADASSYLQVASSRFLPRFLRKMWWNKVAWCAYIHIPT